MHLQLMLQPDTPGNDDGYRCPDFTNTQTASSGQLCCSKWVVYAINQQTATTGINRIN